MKNLVTTLFMTLVFTTAVFAESHDHGHGGQGPNNEGMQDTNIQNDMMMENMGQEQKIVMHKHMQAMQTLVDQINKETDPEISMVLMRKHMESMHPGMQMMGPEMDIVTARDENAMMVDPMDKVRIGMLENQMKVMQRMMELMMSYMTFAHKSS